MSNFANTLTNFVTSARPIIIALVAAAFLIIGAMMIYPSERSKEQGKAALPWVVIGSALALGAVSLATSVGSSF